jgi:AmmeMemoRadiSam system protein B
MSPRERVRLPAVAGQFYADDTEALRAQVDGCLDPEVPKEDAVAIVVPHAGLMYSGKVAGAVYSRVNLPRTALLLGPNHWRLGASASVSAHGRWRTPLGEIAIESELAKALLVGSRVLEEDEQGHLREHSLEVQLPFLSRLKPEIRIVPVSLAETELGYCRDIGQACARALKCAERPVLLIVSTDLNHYESQAVSNQKDRMALEAILALDPEGLHRTVRQYGVSMCGLGPTVVALYALRDLGPRQASLVRYMTSGEVDGRRDRVVGYGGAIIT